MFELINSQTRIISQAFTGKNGAFPSLRTISRDERDLDYVALRQFAGVPKAAAVAPLTATFDFRTQFLCNCGKWT